MMPTTQDVSAEFDTRPPQGEATPFAAVGFCGSLYRHSTLLPTHALDRYIDCQAEQLKQAITRHAELQQLLARIDDFPRSPKVLERQRSSSCAALDDNASTPDPVPCAQSADYDQAPRQPVCPRSDRPSRCTTTTTLSSPSTSTSSPNSRTLEVTAHSQPDEEPRPQDQRQTAPSEAFDQTPEPTSTTTLILSLVVCFTALLQRICRSLRFKTRPRARQRRHRRIQGRVRRRLLLQLGARPFKDASLRLQATGRHFCDLGLDHIDFSSPDHCPPLPSIAAATGSSRRDPREPQRTFSVSACAYNSATAVASPAFYAERAVQPRSLLRPGVTEIINGPWRDWQCSCSYQNFQRRTECLNCGQPKFKEAQPEPSPTYMPECLLQ